jgi:hypothetical protein
MDRDRQQQQLLNISFNPYPDPQLKLKVVCKDSGFSFDRTAWLFRSRAEVVQTERDYQTFSEMKHVKQQSSGQKHVHFVCTDLSCPFSCR